MALINLIIKTLLQEITAISLNENQIEVELKK